MPMNEYKSCHKCLCFSQRFLPAQLMFNKSKTRSSYKLNRKKSRNLQNIQSTLWSQIDYQASEHGEFKDQIFCLKLDFTTQV